MNINNDATTEARRIEDFYTEDFKVGKMEVIA